jgi:Fic family protein
MFNKVCQTLLMATSPHAIPYKSPTHWIRYNSSEVFQNLVDAKASILSLKAIPHQRDWVETLQEIQLKMEVAGTSRIEGAEFTDRELDEALNPRQRATDLLTRSQRQARAAAETYRWIAKVPDDYPISGDFVCDVHRRMVVGCDDDHCPPGRIRGRDENVTFGFPRHRGCDGGESCHTAFSALIKALQTEYKGHDPLIQAMALHYHFAAMHPFLDGNGRTARALEALILQRAGLRDTAFIAMSNYYYEEKPAYLGVLADVRSINHDLTPFINFALRGVAIQCERLFREIKHHIQVAVFRNMMYDLFHHLESPRKRVIAERQIEMLKLLLAHQQIDSNELIKQTRRTYSKLKNGNKALVRDINALISLGAVHASRSDKSWSFVINLDWPEQITETDFMERVRQMPKGKMHTFLS